MFYFIAIMMKKLIILPFIPLPKSEPFHIKIYKYNSVSLDAHTHTDTRYRCDNYCYIRSRGSQYDHKQRIEGLLIWTRWC